MNWATVNKLKINYSKTQVIHITPRHREYQPFPPLRIGNSLIQPVNSARNLGVTVDHHLDLKSHIRNMCQSGWYGIHKIGQLRKYLDQDSAEKLAHAFVTSRLDFCNSLLAGLPSSELGKLQHIQNAAARIVTRTKPRQHITPVLHNLHWLPVSARISFKVLLIMFKILKGDSPAYLQNLVRPYVPVRNLRSSTQNLFSQPRIRTKTYGERAFSWLGPSLWNALPEDVRNSPSINSFKRKLKTHLFMLHF